MKLNSNAIISSADGTFTAYLINQNKMYKLNKTAYFILNLFQEGDDLTEDKVIELCQKEFQEFSIEEVSSYLSNLVELTLLE